MVNCGLRFERVCALELREAACNQPWRGIEMPVEWERINDEGLSRNSIRWLGNKIVAAVQGYVP